MKTRELLEQEMTSINQAEVIDNMNQLNDDSWIVAFYDDDCVISNNQ